MLVNCTPQNSTCVGKKRHDISYQKEGIKKKKEKEKRKEKKESQCAFGTD